MAQAVSASPNVTGDVRIVDGSGGIEVEHVGGSVAIPSDSSGSVDIRDVKRNVTIAGGSAAGLIQCRKCRWPVKSMVMLCSFAAAMTSSSRTEPPG